MDLTIPAPSRRHLRAHAYDPLLAELNDTAVVLKRWRLRPSGVSWR